MPDGLQLPKRLQAAGTLLPATRVIKPELLTYKICQFASEENLAILKQTANVFYTRGLRQGSFDLILCVHEAMVHEMNSFVQRLYAGKGQG